ncbi:GlcG/HbpS family heme-binding protein [Glycomyces paridis]|uniref:Heme-binding protein n=1 Tax=Glycomyces paridis TaxID=2126555 RepID=A0A4S8PMR2_9ACTN|nr:heme-binding protein [Glycomyces paridis]THV32138.1 heme-binding protein [Glycomyces paridis]
MNATPTTFRKRLAVGAVTGLAVVGGIVGVSAYAAPTAVAEAEPVDAIAVAEVQEDGVRASNSLTHEAAMAVLDAAQEKAAELDQRVTVTIVDRDGNTVAMVKGDGAGPQSPDSAEAKAYTAVSWGQATSDLTNAAKGNGPSIADIPGTLFLAGGVPVVFDGAPIAGIGVGGAPSGDIDEEIALAGLAALEDLEG